MRGAPEEVLGGSRATSLGSPQQNGLTKLGGVHTSPTPRGFHTLPALPALLCQVQQHFAHPSECPCVTPMAEGAGIPRRCRKLRHKWVASPPRIAQEADPESSFPLLLLLSSPNPVEQQVQTGRDTRQLSPPSRGALGPQHPQGWAGGCSSGPALMPSFLSTGDCPKMSLWNLVSHMPPEEFSSLSAEFPRSLRCLLAEWLENQPW